MILALVVILVLGGFFTLVSNSHMSERSKIAREDAIRSAGNGGLPWAILTAISVFAVPIAIVAWCANH
jgi:hypothetical protein